MYSRLRRALVAVVAAVAAAAAGYAAASRALPDPYPLALALSILVPVAALVGQDVRVSRYVAAHSKRQLAGDALGATVFAVLVAAILTAGLRRVVAVDLLVLAAATACAWLVGYTTLWRRAPGPGWTTA